MASRSLGGLVVAALAAASLAACSDTGTNPLVGSGQTVSLSFNGTPFTYTSTLDQEQEYSFVPPLVVDASGSATNLTIRVDVSTWFRAIGTGALISPATANVGGANEGVVKENIKNSFKAFRDHDRDGDERDG